MSQKNQFNIYDKNDLPLGSDGLDAKSITYSKETKILKSRIRKAVKTDEETSVKKQKDTSKTTDTINTTDLEELNNQNILQFRHRKKRNVVIITILIIFLLISTIYIGIYAGIIRLKENCFLYVHGASANYIVEGEEISKFRAPQGIGGNRAYVLDVNLRIYSGSYNVKFKVDLFANEMLLDNTLLDFDQDYYRKDSDGYYYSLDKMSGEINLFDRIIIDSSYVGKLNISNFKMEVHTYLYD